LESAYDYLDGIVNSDISRVDGITRDPERARRIMRSYARNQGTQISFSEIARDISTNEIGFSDETISSYVKALKRIFVIDDMPAWNPTLRSKTSFRATDTRYFSDSAIAAASLGIGPNDLIYDLNTFGLLFESMCVRDLRTYADSLNGSVYHYRDRRGLECDAVIHLRDGKYGLVEIKLGGDKLINEGANNLLRLESLIDTEKMNAPSFKMILTAVDRYAYMRPDGVFVVPIGCLKN
jgi:predicted AAA+ superfamily ATPase